MSWSRLMGCIFRTGVGFLVFENKCLLLVCCGPTFGRWTFATRQIVASFKIVQPSFTELIVFGLLVVLFCQLLCHFFDPTMFDLETKGEQSIENPNNPLPDGPATDAPNRACAIALRCRETAAFVQNIRFSELRDVNSLSCPPSTTNHSTLTW